MEGLVDLSVKGGDQLQKSPSEGSSQTQFLFECKRTAFNIGDKRENSSTLSLINNDGNDMDNVSVKRAAFNLGEKKETGPTMSLISNDGKDIDKASVQEASTRWKKNALRCRRREHAMSPKNLYTGSIPPLTASRNDFPTDSEFNSVSTNDLNSNCNFSPAPPMLECTKSLCRDQLNYLVAHRRQSSVGPWDMPDKFISSCVAKVDLLDQLLEQQDEDLNAVEFKIEQSYVELRQTRASFQKARRGIARMEDKIANLMPAVAEAKSNEGLLQFYFDEKLHCRNLKISELKNDIADLLNSIGKLEKARDDAFEKLNKMTQGVL
mmetsp:Transcript_6315/g.9720  ORF Transcript_6315/g.9720 Transcript_6315/m.9720 type:complete len:322 (+) Transcript_6315:169-1134(+)